MVLLVQLKITKTNATYLTEYQLFNNILNVNFLSRTQVDNLVRLIHLFVLSLNLSDFGFKTDFVENGRPAYHPSDLLRLYIYGYLNKIRSSRDLEKEIS